MDVNRAGTGKVVYYSIEPEADAQVFKLQPIVYGEALPLNEATELSVTVTRRARRPWRPANVRAFGTRTPFYKSGHSTIPLTWDMAVPERGAFFASFGAGHTENLPATVLTFVPEDGVGTVFSVTVSAGVTSYTLNVSDIVTNFGVEKSVRVSARHLKNGLLSLMPEELLVPRL
jgi:hypothetical protein